MDYHTHFVAVRLNSQRAAALARETELRRSIIDRGAGLTPSRPEVELLRGLGVWLRRITARTPRIAAAH